MTIARRRLRSRVRSDDSRSVTRAGKSRKNFLPTLGVDMRLTDVGSAQTPRAARSIIG
jgi:hypothetical protein